MCCRALWRWVVVPRRYRACSGPRQRRKPRLHRSPDWSRVLGEGVDTRPYGLPSEFEAHVKRRHVNWLTATRESSVNFTPLHQLDGIITPNGLCFERHHSGVARIDPAEHRLMINGLVETPLVFTLDDIKRFPRTSRACFLECTSNSGMEWRGPQLNGCQYTHGMVHCVMYTGVMLEDVLAEAGLKTKAQFTNCMHGRAMAVARQARGEAFSSSSRWNHRR